MEILKEVPVEIIKEVQVEKQIIKEVQRVDIIPLHSYILGESLIFYADQNIIEVNDVKYNIQGQSSLLLELFFQEKDNGYTLKEDFIIENCGLIIQVMMSECIKRLDVCARFLEK